MVQWRSSPNAELVSHNEVKFTKRDFFLGLFSETPYRARNKRHQPVQPTSRFVNPMATPLNFRFQLLSLPFRPLRCGHFFPAANLLVISAAAYCGHEN
jgi:hypothetical protein